MRVLMATLIASVPIAADGAPRIERIEVLDAGIYTVETGAVTADPSAPLGETVAVTKATLVEATTTIPGRIATDFGYRYRIVGEPEGDAVALDFVVSYPDPGLVDPDAAEPIREVRFSRDKVVGATDYFGYYLEVPWEVVPGTWTFEIWHEGRPLAARTFTLGP